MGGQFLAQVPLFADLPPEDLDRLCEMVEVVSLPPGKTLFAEGDPGDKAYVIEEGEVEVIKASGNREVLLAVRKSGEVIGEMSLLEEAPRMASVRARTRARLLAIEQQQLTELVQHSASAARAMFYTVLARWRATGAMLRQSEKMAQLGTLTAGVAHELNNPAAAVKRGADHLLAALAGQEAAAQAVHCMGLTPQQSGELDRLVTEARLRATKPAELDALARSDRETELEEWLEDREVPEPWELAGPLVDLDYDTAAMDRLEEVFGLGILPPVVRWLAATHGTYNVLAEIQQGAERISKIVGALKQYSFLDQAPVQEVDVHEGIDNTLLILRNKLKTGISVKRDYAPDLPRIFAHGSELNQVWTNLIDNACDALGGQGRITIRTCWEKDWIMVEIEDDGPGIPEEIQGRIFDAFFTTKPPGKGTGQGLAIAWRIVTADHRGSIRLFSQPGSTRFQVTLPINFEEANAVPPALEPERGEDDETWVLENTKRIAVVGMSADEDKPAHTVPAYLATQGYEILPVNPRYEGGYENLKAVPGPIDTVLVFRRSEEVPAIVEDAIAIGAKAVWMQPGVVHDAAAAAARRAGLRVLMDTCMRQARKRYNADRR